MRKAAVALFFSCFLFLFGSACAGAEPIAVIVNKENPVQDLTLEELARFYTGKITRWSHGGAVIAVNRESTASIRVGFYETALKARVNDTFLVPGTGLPFAANIQTSSARVKQVVASVPGAIGYIYASEADETVKVVRVDGLSPDKGGYKLIKENSEKN